MVYGLLVTALVQGTLAGLGYWVAGVSAPILLGLITTLFAMVPFATPIAWGGVGLWLLFQGEMAAGVGVLLWGALVVSQIDNIVRPMLISANTDIPFLLVLLGVLAMFTLPHQFHVGVVECRDERHVLTARWLFPLYLLTIRELQLVFQPLDKQTSELFARLHL